MAQQLFDEKALAPTANVWAARSGSQYTILQGGDQLKLTYTTKTGQLSVS